MENGTGNELVGRPSQAGRSSWTPRACCVPDIKNRQSRMQIKFIYKYCGNNKMKIVVIVQIRKWELLRRRRRRRCRCAEMNKMGISSLTLH